VKPVVPKLEAPWIHVSNYMPNAGRLIGMWVNNLNEHHEITLTGVTVGSNRVPIPGTSIVLHDLAASTTTGDRHVTSDKSGRFSVSALRGRHYRIQGQVLAPTAPSPTQSTSRTKWLSGA